MNININKNIRPQHKELIKFEDDLSGKLKINNSELMQRTMMVITELLENALKFGDYSGENDKIHFNYIKNKNEIKIKISHSASNKKDLDNLQKKVTIIENSKDKKKLYIDRLYEISAGNDMSFSGLGLFRIAYEGEYKISYKFNNDTVHLTATYNFDKKE